MREIPVIIVEDKRITKDFLNELKNGIREGEFKFIAHSSLREPDPRVKVPEDLRDYKKLLQGGDGKWPALKCQAIVVLDMALECTPLAQNEVDDLNTWLGTDYNGLSLVKRQERGLYLVGVALKNTEWNGVIIVAADAGHAALRTAANSLRQSIPRDNIDVYVTDKVTGDHGNESLLKGITMFIKRFGDSLSWYLNQMAQQTAEDCHKGWGINEVPPVFKHLADLLGYQPAKLASKLGMRTVPYPDSSDIVAECLKTLGSKDSHCFSAMGAAFIAWAAYRHHFPDGLGNDKFAKAISGCRGLSGADKVSRYSSIIVPQESARLKETIKSFYEMMKSMLKADKKTKFCAQGDDLLIDVQLDRSGLRIHCMQYPDLLSKPFDKIIRKLIISLNQASSESTGNTVCRKILRFWMQSAISDKVQFGSEQRPFLHAPLRICPAGDEPKTGTVIRFEI